MKLTTNEILYPYAAFDQGKSNINQYDAAFYHIFTAAALNHKQGRFSLSVYYQNGLIPHSEESKLYLEKDFDFLQILEPKSLLFELEHMSTKEFEIRSQSESLINLYLASMVPLPEQLYQQQETSTSDDSSSTNSKTTNPSSPPNLEEQQHLSYL